MLVVGNKCDQDVEVTTRVNTSDAQRFADDHRMPLFETSAKDDSKADHVEGIFLTLAHKIHRNESMKTRSADEDEVKGDKKVILTRSHPDATFDEENSSSCCI